MSDKKFAEDVHNILEEIEDLLIAKNEKYGNSALEPLGVFSKLSAKEGLLVRIDDKLKRIKNGSLDKDDEDVVNDLIGYLVLLKIHAKSKYESISVQSNGEGSIGTIITPNGMSTSTTRGYPIGSGWSYTSSKSHNED